MATAVAPPLFGTSVHGVISFTSSQEYGQVSRAPLSPLTRSVSNPSHGSFLAATRNIAEVKRTRLVVCQATYDEHSTGKALNQDAVVGRTPAGEEDYGIEVYFGGALWGSFPLETHADEILTAVTTALGPGVLRHMSTRRIFLRGSPLEPGVYDYLAAGSIDGTEMAQMRADLQEILRLQREDAAFPTMSQIREAYIALGGCVASAFIPAAVDTFVGQGAIGTATRAVVKLCPPVSGLLAFYVAQDALAGLFSGSTFEDFLAPIDMPAPPVYEEGGHMGL